MGVRACAFVLLVLVLMLICCCAQESTYASVVCDADQLLLLSEAGAPGAVLGANM